MKYDQFHFCHLPPGSCWLRTQRKLNYDVECRLNGDDYGRSMNVIVMNRESAHRHDKWCHSLCSVLSMQRMHRQRDSVSSRYSKYIDKVIDNGFHCESNDRLQITWSSLNILKWNQLDIVDAVFDFFDDFNQSLAPKRF